MRSTKWSGHEYKFWSENLKGRDYLEDLDVNEKIMLARFEILTAVKIEVHLPGFHSVYS
jgi:hypothetical protein